ncbi:MULTISPECIES: hypothetical protein [Aeromonas]|uniref:Uncharacterized protein n=1 Tax=Aeromonas hydrophila TaxID=644 RepID=A0A8I0B882_AERHY|nr:hypothetical protein [Aeromonas hydrophila]MBC8670834.1 hypothetical protein [Aeromonas hydrophila]MBC8674198.1 hypothetical protein [Aeromonas hydrophila]MBC8686515.1 hypothetical protein [Aeromonas hydrophila]
MTREVLNKLLNRLYGDLTIALNWKDKLVLQRRFIALSRGARKYHAMDLAGDATRCAEQLMAELEAERQRMERAA